MLQIQEQRKMGGEKFHVKRGSLSFSADPVSITAEPGEVKEGTFTIYGPDGKSAAGFVTSSQLPVKVLTPSFEGAGEVISFRFDGSAFRAGEQLDGVFRILSDAGEYELPFAVRVREEELDSELGPIRNLVHFTNLARMNWREAVQMFYRPEFGRMVEREKAARNLFTLYRGLSARPGNEHNVEEFLIASGGKQPAEFSADVREIRMELPAQEQGLLQQKIGIRRSGWGYTSVGVSVSGDFLSVGTVPSAAPGGGEISGAEAGDGGAVLREADFRDGTASVTILLDASRMHGGKNFGHVFLTPAYGTPIAIPVEVSHGVSTALQRMRRKEEHQVILQMMQEYLALRGGKSSSEFRVTMESLIRRLHASDRDNPLTDLYRIHYLVTAGDENDAFWELQALNRRLSGTEDELQVWSVDRFDLEDDTAYAYRMYLTGLIAVSRLDAAERGGNRGPGGQQPARVVRKSADDAAEFSMAEAGQAVENTTRVIREMHRRNPDNFWIAWLLIYADADFSRRTGKTAVLLRDQYQRGSRSPVLYMEAWQLLQADPSLLSDLGDYELQVLIFAVRHGLMTETVLSQVNYLAIRRKTFSMKLFRILAGVYEKASVSGLQLRDTLESICTLLIRGGITDSSFFVWYQRGVEQGLSITRLLDYYMLSLPADFGERGGELPQMVVMYYAYQNVLPWRQRAYLYRYVCEHQDAFPEVYGQYAPAVDQFTLEQLSQHRINEDLAWLYTRYLTAGRVLGDDIASAAVPAVFACRIRIGRDGAAGNTGKRRQMNPDGAANPAAVQRIVVTEDRDLAETYCPVDHVEGCLPVYGTECAVFLEDSCGNRYAVSVPYTLTRLMDYEKLAPLLAVYGTNNTGFDLYLTGEGRSTGRKSGRAGRNPGEDPEDAIRRRKRLAESQSLLPAERVKTQRELLDLCRGNDNEKELRELLTSVSLTEWGRDGRNEALRAMAVEGLFRIAWSWVCRFGTADVDADVLLRLVTGLLSENEAGTRPEEALSETAYAAFAKGKYSPVLLRYLGEFWDGLTREMDGVREALLRSDMDDFPVSRRMLAQMLFTGERTGSRPALIHTCRKGGTDAEFLADVLAQSSHFCFIDKAEMTEEEYALIAEYGMEGVPLLDICRIAWLSHQAGQQGEARDQASEVTELFLSDLLGRGIVFPFFRQFVGVIPGMEAYADVTLVEYRAGRTDAPARILYHYAMEQNGVREPYAAKEMKEMYSGVYVTGFLLFFGEQMHYYITDDPAEKNVVESGTVSQDARLMSGSGGRFGAVNEIAMLVAMGRDEEALQKLDTYGQKAYLAQKLFTDVKETE